MNVVSYGHPNGPFAAYWLGHATAVAETHPRPFVRTTLPALAPWVAASVDNEGHVCEKLRTMAWATGLTRTQVRSAFRELQRAGLITAEFRSAYDGTALPTNYTLALPASIVQTELQRMASQEVGA